TSGACKKQREDEPAAAQDPPKQKKKKPKDDVEACGKTFADVDDTCSCSAEHLGGMVYGTDVFTESSSPCAAALHAGVIKKSGGTVTVKRGKGCDAYVASSKNGVASHGSGKASKSYYFPDKSDGKCRKAE